ncbi:MAG: ABC transporter permease, partial [Flavobacterium sp.]
KGWLHDELKSTDKLKYTDLSALPLDVAKKTASEEYEGFVYVPPVEDISLLTSKVEFLSNESPNLELVGGIEDAIDDKVTK